MKKKTKNERVAEAILQSVCSKMKVRAHAFIPILDIMKFEPMRRSSKKYLLGTDGEVIYYNPLQIIQIAKEKVLLPKLERTIFHIILHGLLGHFEQTGWRDKKLSGAVKDIQVARCMRMLYSDEELEVRRKDESDLLDNYFGDELYFKGLKDEVVRKSTLSGSKKFTYDNHNLWDSSKVSKAKVSKGKGSGKEGDGVAHPENKEGQSLWDKGRKLLLGKEPKDAASMEKQIRGLLGKQSGSSKQYGQNGGDAENEVEWIKSSNSYKELMEKITSLSERVLEEQEIDKVLYQYGLELYGDVPLVEPEEITEKHCLNTLVVAVDTSGSCTHRAALFFREMVEVFEEIRKIGSIKHICYLECDTEITKQMDCYDVEEFIEFGKTHTFRGGGGTNFTPVFQYADSLLEAGELVDAVIYITDAYGDFPDTKPEYDTYLLLDVDSDEDWDYLEAAEYIPEWAECIVMENQKGSNE